MAHMKGTLTRRVILDAAIARFGRDGYKSTSVADIARDAGVGGTVAYAYFPNKEALFLAAVDEDAATMINDGVSRVVQEAGVHEWLAETVVTVLSLIERHPLARRVLGGLEPDVTERVLEIPALTELRKVCADRLSSLQLSGLVRSDIDPVAVGNGVVAIMLSLLMSVIQIGPAAALLHGDDVAAVFAAALGPIAPPATD